jgi:hypothetical protein
MKTAVLFFGEIRGGDAIWENIHKHIVKANNADVFIHGYWYNEKFMDEMSPVDRETYKMYHRTKGVHYYPPNSLFKIFSPKQMIVEENNRDYHVDNGEFVELAGRINKDIFGNGDTKMENAKISYNTIRSQAYSRKQVMEMKMKFELDHNMKYDNVIMTRLDIDIFKPVSVVEKIPDDMILAKKLGNPHIFEQLLVGSNNAMNVLAKFFEKSPLMYLQLCNRDRPFMQNEFFMGKFINDNQITVMNCDFPLNYAPGLNGLARFNVDFVTGDTNTISQIQR